MLQLFEYSAQFFEVILQHAVLGTLLIGLLLIVTLAFRNRVSPRVCFGLWLLVPLQLLWFVTVPSSLSLRNYLPEMSPRTQTQYETQAVAPPVVSPITDDWQSIDISEWDTEPDFFDVEPDQSQFNLLAWEDELEFFADDQTEEIAQQLPEIFEVEQSPEQRENTALREVWPWVIRYGAAIWAMGVLVFYLVYFFQVFRFQHWIRTARTLTDQNALRLFDHCKKRMHINSWVLVVESPRVHGPFLIGVFRPIIVLPQGLAAASNDQELEHLFSHELAHLKRSDLIVGWLMTFVLGLYWFHPLLWLAVRCMNQLREEASDAMVLKSLGPEQQLDYGTTLLTMSRKFANPRFVPGIAGILETRSFLHRRIDMITRPRTWRTRWALLVTALCVCVLATLITNAKPQSKPVYETKPNASVDTSTQEQEYTVGVPEYETKQKREIDPKRVPKIIATFPENNAKNVDPNITQVYITFDIPMGGGMAWAQRSNQTALDFDEDKGIFWTADGRTCVASVKLKSNKTYETLMNVPPFIGFRSEGGMPSDRLFYTFKTGRESVSEKKRAEQAANNLTKESDSPEVEGFDPNAGEEDPDEDLYVDAELEKKGRQAIKAMAERGKYWIFAQCYKAESWSYHFKNFGIDENGEQQTIVDENGKMQPDKLKEYDIEIDREDSAPWEQIRGITYYSVLQALATLAIDEDNAGDIRFKAVAIDENEVKLHYVVKKHDLGCRIGNGMNGSWMGFFQATHNEGQLVLDRKTLMPKTLTFNEKSGERYGKFVTAGKGLYVPQRIQVKNGDMLFDMNFNAYEPGLWLLDNCTYTYTDKDGSKFRAKSEVSDVKVNGKPGVVLKK